ncbi:iron-sulfur cluster assembly scaffold protein [Bacteriovorax sp. PP10]|uniref:Iron-sulfur cluster assembly scaffold protein n=1 Tax=Bacteriovorax antarcticus TaxID=3088717 RepID=A0ABU5VXH6_9BACT|nr:iron-sulfur cluster assembly scaffold protein [Bacteriovorax sp. PP10]MEA9357657.1 iron-sulfur cluster assembly scaffold protein [Bacteriovorax sp. PP10]
MSQEIERKGQCHNPLYGDKIAISIMSKDGILQSIKILPTGCSISAASASLIADLIEGKTIAEVEEFITSVNEHFSLVNAHKEWPKKLKFLSPLRRIRETPFKDSMRADYQGTAKEALKNYQSSTKIEDSDKVETRKDT